MNKAVINNLVVRVYLLRALHIIGIASIMLSVYLSADAAVVCLNGCILWGIANRVRPTRFERGGIWSREFMKLARIHTKRTKTARPR